MADDIPQLTGRIVYPDSKEYHTARLTANFYASKNSTPRVIVYCQKLEDVQNAVIWARHNNVPIRIRSGGHCHQAFSTSSNTIVVDVSEMKLIEIDTSKNQATIQSGATNKELYSTLFEHGLTFAGGTCGDVAISGLVLSGGIGPLYRRAGLSCDTLLALDIVNAEGKLLHVTKDNEHKDLFWALCGGGGGNFGIVTSLTLKLFPIAPVTWFQITWDWSQPIGQVISKWQQFFSKVDEKWFSHLDLWSKAFPKDLLRKSPVKVLGIYWGAPADAKAALQLLLSIGKPASQSFEQVSWHHAVQAIESSTAVFLTKQPEYKSTGAFINEMLPQSAIDALVTTLQDSKWPLLNALVCTLGASVTNDNAYYYRDAKFFINYTMQWLDPENDIQCIGEVDALRKKLSPYTKGDYVGNPDLHLKEYMIEYYGENAKRLKEIKKKYDPRNTFHFEQSIR